MRRLVFVKPGSGGGWLWLEGRFVVEIVNVWGWGRGGKY